MGYRSSGYGTTEKVYDFLLEYIDKNGFAPSVREIGEEVGLKSTSSVVYHLSTLEEEGRIEVRENSPRAIKLVGYNYTKEGNDMKDIKESNQIRNKIFNNVIADLKKKFRYYQKQKYRESGMRFTLVRKIICLNGKRNDVF